MADVANYISQFLRLNADKAFALAAAGITIILLRRNGLVAADSSEMWVAYAGLFGVWLLVAKVFAWIWRSIVAWRDARPDYSLYKNRTYLRMREASSLLAREKPWAGMSPKATAWFAALRDVIAQNNIEFIDRRVGHRTGWPDAESRIHKDQLREAVDKMDKRVPRWLKK